MKPQLTLRHKKLHLLYFPVILYPAAESHNCDLQYTFNILTNIK